MLRIGQSEQVAARQSFSTRRSQWVPPAVFLVLSMAFLAGAPELGSRIFYAVLVAASAYWLIRAWRVGVDISDDGLQVRGQLRTQHFAWTQLRRAATAPMRTRSPFQGLYPYVTLTVELADGRSRHFEEVSVAASKQATVQHIVDAINARL